MIRESSVRVVIVPEGRIVTGYNRLTWRVSMIDKALPFALSVGWGVGESGEISETLKIGHIIAIYVNDTVQFTGEIEDIVFHRDRSGGRVLVASGRDLYGSAVSSDADPRISLDNLSFEEQMQRLFGAIKLPIEFVNLDSARENLSRNRSGPRNIARAAPRTTRHNHKIKPGETISTVVDDISKKHGVLVWTQPSQEPDGGILVCVGKPSYNAAPTYRAVYVRDASNKPTPESNMLSIAYRVQVRNIPTQVFAYGRGPRGDVRPVRVRVQRSQEPLNVLSIDTTTWTVSRTEYRDPDRIIQRFVDRVRSAQSRSDSNRSSDQTGRTTRSTPHRMPFSNSDIFKYPFVADTLRPRIKHLHTRRAKDPNAGEQEARSYIARANTKLRVFDARIQGFTCEHNGVVRIWTVNSMCSVVDSDLGIQEDMMIQEIEFDESRNDGQTVKLTLCTKGALDLEPSQ